MKYEDITRRIIKCAMQVHNTLGNGFQEVIYQRSLEIEMRLDGLSFVREKEIPIFYRNTQIGTRRVDFFVENNYGGIESSYKTGRCKSCASNELFGSV